MHMAALIIFYVESICIHTRIIYIPTRTPTRTPTHNKYYTYINRYANMYCNLTHVYTDTHAHINYKYIPSYNLTYTQMYNYISRADLLVCPSCSGSRSRSNCLDIPLSARDTGLPRYMRTPSAPWSLFTCMRIPPLFNLKTLPQARVTEEWCGWLLIVDSQEQQ